MKTKLGQYIAKLYEILDTIPSAADDALLTLMQQARVNVEKELKKTSVNLQAIHDILRPHKGEKTSELEQFYQDNQAAINSKLSILGLIRADNRLKVKELNRELEALQEKYSENPELSSINYCLNIFERLCQLQNRLVTILNSKDEFARDEGIVSEAKELLNNIRQQVEVLAKQCSANIKAAPLAKEAEDAHAIRFAVYARLLPLLKGCEGMQALWGEMTIHAQGEKNTYVNSRIGELEGLWNDETTLRIEDRTKESNIVHKESNPLYNSIMQLSVYLNHMKKLKEYVPHNGGFLKQIDDTIKDWDKKIRDYKTTYNKKTGSNAFQFLASSTYGRVVSMAETPRAQAQDFNILVIEYTQLLSQLDGLPGFEQISVPPVPGKPSEEQSAASSYTSFKSIELDAAQEREMKSMASVRQTPENYIRNLQTIEGELADRMREGHRDGDKALMKIVQALQKKFLLYAAKEVSYTPQASADGKILDGDGGHVGDQMAGLFANDEGKGTVSRTIDSDEEAKIIQLTDLLGMQESVKIDNARALEIISIVDSVTGGDLSIIGRIPDGVRKALKSYLIIQDKTLNKEEFERCLSDYSNTGCLVC